MHNFFNKKTQIFSMYNASGKRRKKIKTPYVEKRGSTKC
jgi:hypothetical protein